VAVGSSWRILLTDLKGLFCGKEIKMENESETLVGYGSEVKALGDGKVGGYLVRFTDENSPDITGDFFDKSTDFGEIKSSPVLYHHGLDKKVGIRVFGNGELKMDDIGIWIEAQLSIRDAYEKAIYKLAEAGKLGWSSGTASHLVKREEKGKAWHTHARSRGTEK
jgi:phage head maturation protease